MRVQALDVVSIVGGTRTEVLYTDPASGNPLEQRQFAEGCNAINVEMQIIYVGTCGDESVNILRQRVDTALMNFLDRGILAEPSRGEISEGHAPRVALHKVTIDVVVGRGPMYSETEISGCIAGLIADGKLSLEDVPSLIQRAREMRDEEFFGDLQARFANLQPNEVIAP